LEWNPQRVKRTGKPKKTCKRTFWKKHENVTKTWGEVNGLAGNSQMAMLQNGLRSYWNESIYYYYYYYYYYTFSPVIYVIKTDL